MVSSNAEQLFIQQPYTGGESQRFNEMDVETFAHNKPEGTDAVEADVVLGYSKDLSLTRMAIEITITHEMRRRNRYQQVGNLITGLSHFCPQRFQLDLTHRLTFATSTSYTDMDGDTVDTAMGDTYALAYATHLVKSGDSYRNRISTDPAFSIGALESAMELANTNILSNFGERRVMNFNTIVTGDDPNTVHTVMKYLTSTGDPDAAHAGVTNVIKGKFRHIILPQLATTSVGAYDSTKKRWWGLFAIGNGDGRSWPAYYVIDEPARLSEPDIDVHNDNLSIGVRMSKGICVVSGRGAIMSCPTS